MLIWSTIVLLALLLGFLLLKLRLRLVWGELDRTVFVGLGRRSGAQIDFITRLGEVRLLGVKIKTFGISSKAQAAKSEEIKSKSESIETKSKVKKPKERRKIPHREFARILPRGARAFWKFSVGLFKAVKIEEARGKITAGFDSPDLTGQAFGYYQAVASAVPRLSYISYTPVWHERYFAGSVSFAAGLPLYHLVAQTLLLLWRLPITRIVRIFIGKRKGVQDGQQRS